jgi:hypothetical protein
MKNANNITARLKNIQQNTTPTALARVAYDTFKEYTPVDKGNARNKTRLKNEIIHADYPYAVRLDQGYSKQKGGVGMTNPTIKAVQKYIADKA